MPIDWDKVDVEGAIDGAVKATDQKLASRISSLTRMSDEEIQALFPAPVDVRRLEDLMTIVRSSDSRNTKLNRIAAGYEDFGEIMLTLLDKVV